MNFETRQRCGTCPPSNRTKWGSCANCQRWGTLVCSDCIQVFCKDYSHPGIQIPADFYPERSSGHVVPRWKSPDVMVTV